jgi:hypothetical protein
MANVLSLALRVTADASGLKLDPVQRALVGLGDQADKLTSQFAKFAGESEAAASAQANFDKQAQDLINTLRDGGSATEFAAGFERLTETINKEAAAFERAARITEANISPLQKFEAAQAELTEQVNAGRISQETYERALAKAKSQLDGTATSASKTDKSIESLTKNVRLLSAIEIGRLIVDGLQTIGNVISGALSQVSAFVSRISSAFDSFNDLSARTGIGVEALQGYSLAAKLAGVDTEAFGSAVQRLAVTIGKATPGDNLDKSLRNINLSVAQLRGLAPEQQFSAISDAISGLPTAADRAAAAVEIFGKQGAALAPLFREGAESIEDLRERAQRLGIIVDETQLSNIGAMNDAFDLARATVEGIAGQVIGNLAPAVTGVVDQFLKFIEEWNGAEGRGGTGIANAISEILLDGAQVLADVFDSLTGYLTGFSIGFDQIAKTFSVVGNVLIAASESFRAVFNFFQTVVSFLTERLGRFLEGLGSWVSSDLQEFGKNLADAAREQGVQNARQLEDAAKNAAGAFNRALDGGSGSTQQAGAGVAARFMSGVRAQFERERAPSFKVESNIETTGERLTAFIKTVGDGADKFYLDSVETLKVFERQAAEGELTAAQIKIMSGFMEQLNGQLDQEIAKRQEAAEAAQKQASEIDAIVAASEQQARIDKEFGGNPARAKAADNLLKIQQEIVRVEEQIRLAREAGDQSTLDSLTGRLATLDQVASREQDIAAGRAKAGKEAARDTEGELERIEKQIAQSRSALLDRQFEIELARAEELATVRTGSVEINDIRSGGISAFFDTLKEDPAIAEAKAQTKELQAMRKEIAKLNAEKVDILAGTG